MADLKYSLTETLSCVGVRPSPNNASYYSQTGQKLTRSLMLNFATYQREYAEGKIKTFRHMKTHHRIGTSFDVSVPDFFSSLLSSPFSRFSRLSSLFSPASILTRTRASSFSSFSLLCLSQGKERKSDSNS